MVSKQTVNDHGGLNFLPRSRAVLSSRIFFPVIYEEDKFVAGGAKHVQQRGFAETAGLLTL